MSSFEVIIRHSVELERILSKNLGAKGRDLHAKLHSVHRRLPAALIAQVEYLIDVRDEAVNAAVVPDDPTEFKGAFAGVIQAFERIVGPIERSAATKTSASAKVPVIAPAAEPIEPMAMPALSAWQIAQPEVAIEQMFGSLLTRSEQEPDASAPDEASPPIEIRGPHDETLAPAQPKEITMGALLLRPSVEPDVATPPVEIREFHHEAVAPAPPKEITMGALLLHPTAEPGATPTEPPSAEPPPVETISPVVEDR